VKFKLLVNLTNFSTKGRFRDKIRYLLDFIRDEKIYPLNKYGSLVCTSVLEHTTNSKAKGIAIRELQTCVELNGLPSVSKKGILVVAKGFMEENIPDNRTYYLDLIETIVMKMNGDVGKFFKICGSTMLSRKDKDIIEARIARSKSKIIASHEKNAGSSPKGSSTTTVYSPHLDPTSTDEHEGPFKFSFGSKPEVTRTSFQMEGDVNRSTDAPSGAAASLRERLRQIRDKHSQDDGVLKDYDIPLQSQHLLRISSHPVSCKLYDDIAQAVGTVLQQPTPLLEINESFTKALIGLRQLHSSLSNSKNDSTGTNPILLDELHQFLYGKVPETVEMLTRYVVLK